MESVNLMNLRKILKNRKAMTPVMIGIIVVASVISVLFLVLAITIPYTNKDVHMQINLNSIRGNTTDQESLIFKIVCDFDNGTVTKFEIYQDSVLFGDKNQTEVFSPRETRYIQIRYFDANLGVVPSGQIQNGTHLKFLDGFTYTLRIYYQDLDGIAKPYSEIEFDYNDYD